MPQETGTQLLAINIGGENAFGPKVPIGNGLYFNLVGPAAPGSFVQAAPCGGSLTSAVPQGASQIVAVGDPRNPSTTLAGTTLHVKDSTSVELAAPLLYVSPIQRGAPVAVVTENLVRRFWPGQDPLGKRIREGRPNSSNKRWLSIIGVVEEMKYRGLPQNPTADPDLFQVFNQRSRDFALLVRTSLPPASMLSAIRKALLETDPSILVYDAGPLEDLMGHETARSRFTGWLLAVFALLALGLAMIGIYGVVSFRVSRQTREIGLRMALGAGRRQVLGTVIRRGMILVVAGLMLGGVAALALTRVMSTLIYDVSPTDPITFVAAACVLASVGALACLIPASRASRIDPVIALRNE